MSDLRNKVIKLAYEKPELREDLLPLVKKEAIFGLFDSGLDFGDALYRALEKNDKRLVKGRNGYKSRIE